MKNFWTILFVILAVIVGIRVLSLFFSISMVLLRPLIYVGLIGFAIYGLTQFFKNR